MMKVFVAALTAVVLLGGCREEHAHDAADGHHATTTATTTSSTTAASAPFDLQFLDTMSRHHQGAVEMARMAEGKIQHAELKKLVARIPSDQQKEIDQMKSWREQWYAGAQIAENMQMPGMQQSHMDMGHMETMTAGAAYDAMFIDMMIPHHEGAITMARDALTKAEHQEVKALAQRIIDAQTREIEQMRQWQSELKR